MAGHYSPNYNPESVNCAKGLWVSYDLTYAGGSFDGVREELSEERSKCEG